MNRPLIRHGFVLLLLALLGGLAVQAMAIPRLGLSAHTIGLISGLLLIALGAIWPVFRLSRQQQRLHYGCWVYSSYANWAAVLFGGLTGAGWAAPIAAAGRTGPTAAEWIMSLGLVSVAVTSLLAVSLSLWGLRGADARALGDEQPD
ncbi:hypothetical protein [Wenzhouxiangella marina]|uniref:Uncharacterized protein n=1 Tax=Wenzhouxiangella marina TaxID=1579979 RepID=A0A0K0Y099_9GAMM|nr:hypothetical protein [Wenzhouxiangella marina]AKS43373.1 hypothetical protein WM2015_3021 [Wenzhouxiangella marina]MBB6088511.1 hydroxylaminobenzene mutase [Wenzhouxiangella marina]